MIEIIRPCNGARPRLAILDFDGTLSLIRSGWQHLMSDLMLEELRPHTSGVEPHALRQTTRAAIDRLTGRPTLAQMEWLAEQVALHGGTPGDPVEYKRRFATLLDTQVEHRLTELRGTSDPRALLVPGSIALLNGLREQGVILTLLSGTDVAEVRVEAAALGIADFFGEHIYGPAPDTPPFSKHNTAAQLLAEYALPGNELVAIGDGPAEIIAARALGGVAVGVAFNEDRGTGLDQRKRTLLIDAGADIIIVDLEEHEELLGYLFGQ